jgi:hypothetical protein
MKGMMIALVTMILTASGLGVSQAWAWDSWAVRPAVAHVNPASEDVLGSANVHKAHYYGHPRRYYRHYYRPYYRPYYGYYGYYPRPYYYGYPYPYYGSPLGFSLSLPFLHFHLGL